MRFCIITPLPLFPNSSGGTVRIVNIIRHLIKKGHEIRLILPYIYTGTEQSYKDLFANTQNKFYKTTSFKIQAPSNKNSTSRQSSLRKLRSSVPFNFIIFTPPNLVKILLELKAWSPNIILAEFDGSWPLGYILEKLLRSPLIVDKHNIETVLYHQLKEDSELNIGKSNSLKERIVRFAEFMVWSQTQGIITVSKNDLLIGQQLFGYKKNAIVVSNGVEDIKCLTPAPKKNVYEWLKIPTNGKIMLFHGLASYPPNLYAIKRVIGQILPMIRENSPTIDYYAVIVGPGNAKKDEIIIRDHVRLVGEVTRSKLVEIICSSDAAVVPLQSGSGTRMKILEYFSAGIPVIATSMAVEGLPVKNNVELIICNKDFEIAQATVEVIQNDFLKEKLTKEASKMVKEFSWPFVLKPLEEFAIELGAQLKKRR